ncbi:hypothetical protein MLAC_04120 [Mycobacterium lacus]|uniref:Uncharacterized protein n=1 Tax=Mycobacterium lacus TaxID=169765 RepID=A0A7I7NFE3_9MYCO|nr:hypothetical protein MLAC_04120 [Mycobacterium lacus]
MVDGGRSANILSAVVVGPVSHGLMYATQPAAAAAMGTDRPAVHAAVSAVAVLAAREMEGVDLTAIDLADARRIARILEVSDTDRGQTGVQLARDEVPCSYGAPSGAGFSRHLQIEFPYRTGTSVFLRVRRI